MDININNYNYLQLEPIKYPLVNKFYRNENAKSKAKGHDTVWIAKDRQSIIAATRITPLPGNIQLLTSVYVAPVYRKQGIAFNLVKQCCLSNGVIYTFSLTHLTDFYQQLGFKQLSPNQLPCELAQRFSAYINQGRQIVAMIKE